jgi:microcystin-dependent protein
MWNGTTVPNGWALCNGNNSTPDLRGKFIVGYNSSDADYNQIGDNGGAKTVTLTTAQMPSHLHDDGNLLISKDGDHNHKITINSGSGVGSAHRVASVDASNGAATFHSDYKGEHDHTISGNTGSTGSGNAHENRPPYYTLAYIIKL